MSTPEVGQKVWYVPHQDHWSDGGDHFHFVNVEDGPPLSLARQKAGEKRQKKGEPYTGRAFQKRHVNADPPGDIGRVGEDGTIYLADGHTLRPAGAKAHWPGVVSHEVVVTPGEVVTLPDGRKAQLLDETRRLVLDVKHPNGFVTLHLPLEGDAAVPHDAGKGHHTYHHREGE